MIKLIEIQIQLKLHFDPNQNRYKIFSMAWQLLCYWAKFSDDLLTKNSNTAISILRQTWISHEKVRWEPFPYEFKSQWQCCFSVNPYMVIILPQMLHYSTSVVACAEICSDQYIRLEMRAKLNFYQIWIVVENLSVKWAPRPSMNISQSSYLTGTLVMNNTYDYINSIDMISQPYVMCIHSK